MKNNDLFNIDNAMMNEGIDFDQIRRDADASLKANIDKQSDARIAQAKQPKPGFFNQVGKKQIGMVKGAVKGAMKGLRGEPLDEVNPHNYDSDEDYYAALKAPAKRRSQNDYPYTQQQDDDYFRELFRKQRAAKAKAEREADHDRIATGTNEDAEMRGQNRLWAQITDYEKRAKATKNDIKKQHYMKMASELRSKLKTSDEQGMAEAEGDCEGLPHLTPDLAKHISQQIDTEGPHAVEKSIEWGDGAAKELLAKIKAMLDDYAAGKQEDAQMFEAFEQYVSEQNLTESVFDTYTDEQIINEVAAWQKKSGKNKNGGLNAKGVASYRREHPGSKLQTAVTTKPSKLKKGSKAAKRRKSFCARMGGMKGPMKDKHGKPTRKALALRKWHCESLDQLGQLIESTIVELKQRLDPKCWKGHHKAGTKIKGGVRVNNCVPNESANPAQQAAIAINKKKQQDMSEGAVPDYSAMFESQLNEFSSAGGTGGIATSMSVGNPAAGSLFGGSYSQKNSPFKKTAKKRTGKIIKR